MIKAKEYACATELLDLLLNVYQKAQLDLNEENVARLRDLFNQYDPKAFDGSKLNSVLKKVEE